MINLHQNLTLTISKTGFVHYFVDENAMSVFGKILRTSLFHLESVCDLTVRLFKQYQHMLTQTSSKQTRTKTSKRISTT